MSDAQLSEHESQDSQDSHEGPIKTPQQLVAAVVASFLVPIVVIIMLANFVNFGDKSGAGSDAMTADAVGLRIQPVGRIEVKDASDAATLKTGEQVYAAQCSACHATGAAGAPKFGDEALWGPRIKTGYPVLLASALKGKGNMGAQGGGDFSDVEIGRAVVYMANKAGGKLDEPKLPAVAASGAASVTASGAASVAASAAVAAASK